MDDDQDMIRLVVVFIISLIFMCLTFLALPIIYKTYNYWLDEYFCEKYGRERDCRYLEEKAKNMRREGMPSDKH